MIIDEVVRRDMPKHGLGLHRTPPASAVKSLEELDKKLEFVWNSDEAQWEIYRLTTPGINASEDILNWQNTAPPGEPTAAIKIWLQKFDTTKGGTRDSEDRERDYIKSIHQSLANQDLKKEKDKQEQYYELGHVCKYLGGMAMASKSPNIVVPEAVGVTQTGVPIRLIPPPVKSKEIIV